MWPFPSSEVKKLIGRALAPGVLPSAREEAIKALRVLPQKPESLECYSRIALDPKQVWKVRYAAMEGMKLNPNEAGARALLRCVAIDLRRPAIAMLGRPGLPEALRPISADAMEILADALHQISAAGEKTTDLLLGKVILDELESLLELLRLVATPEALDLLLNAQGVSFQIRNRLVPRFLENALTSKYHREVKEAIAALEQLGTTEAKSALEDFRRMKSRLVEKTLPPGVGSTAEICKIQVYTSEFGQQKSEEEIAYRAGLGQPAPSAPDSPPSRDRNLLEIARKFRAEDDHRPQGFSFCSRCGSSVEPYRSNAFLDHDESWNYDERLPGDTSRTEGEEVYSCPRCAARWRAFGAGDTGRTWPCGHFMPFYVRHCAVCGARENTPG